MWNIPITINKNRISKLVSIIILTYQDFSHLFETLESIFQQDYLSIEVWISDDGSKNFPDEQLALWQKKNINDIPLKIRKNNQNVGIVAHANLVVQECKGEYIKFLPSGDGFCTQDALSRLINLAEKTQQSVVLSPAFVCGKSFNNIYYQYPSKRRIKDLQKKSPQKLFSIVARNNFISAVGALYHISFFCGIKGGFDQTYRNLDDWPTWLCLLRKGVWLPCLDQPTVYYRLGGISSSFGTAFDAPLLKKDLTKCIEKEILPFTNMLSMSAKIFIGYRYATLQKNQDHPLPFKYLLIDFLMQVKKLLKKQLIKRNEV